MIGCEELVLVTHLAGLASLFIQCKPWIFLYFISGFCAQGGDPTGTGMGEQEI